MVTQQPHGPNPLHVGPASTGFFPGCTTAQLMTPAVMASLRLDATDIPFVQKLAAQIGATEKATVLHFGEVPADSALASIDKILQHVRNGDLQEAGEKLSHVHALVRSLQHQFGTLSANRSEMPIVGQLIGRIRLKASNAKSQFESASKQIQRLLAEVMTLQRSLYDRHVALSAEYVSVQSHYRTLRLYVAAGKVRLEELQAQAAHEKAAAASPAQPQVVEDLQAQIARLQWRVADLATLQMTALLLMPQIRIVQAKQEAFCGMFESIRAAVVPAWTRQAMLALGLAASEVTPPSHGSVDPGAAEPTQERNAQKLQQTYTSLIASLDDVLQAKRAGVEACAEAEATILAMRGQLQVQLVPEGAMELG